MGLKDFFAFFTGSFTSDNGEEVEYGKTMWGQAVDEDSVHDLADHFYPGEKRWSFIDFFGWRDKDEEE